MNIQRHATTNPTGQHRLQPARARLRGTRSAFTLMELVVASALMATLMVGLWGLVNIFTSLANKGTVQLQRIRDATQFFQWLESDLQRVPDTMVRTTTPSLLGNASTLDMRHVASPSLQWLGQAQRQTEHQPRHSPGRLAPRQLAPRQLARRAGGMEMTAAAGRNRPLGQSGRRVPPETVANGATPALPAVRRVRYRFQTSSQSMGGSPPGVDAAAMPTNHVGLWRYDEQSAAGGERWLESALQFRAVEAVRFSYFNGHRWAARWNSAAQGGLPIAVRIEAWFAGGTVLGSPLAADDLDTADQQSADGRSVGTGSTTDQTAWSWVDALAPSESRALPDRRADLTRWVALR